MLWFKCTSVTMSVASYEGVIADTELVIICHRAVALSSHTIHSSCHYIKCLEMLALVSCTFERCDGNGHICC